MYVQTLLYLSVLAVCIATNNAEEIEGSGDVCNVDGSTCPDDKCCRQSKCDADSPELHCCESGDSDPTCANCPTCSKYFSVF